jgi:GNAT superfamily N-acetyltransferase
MLRWRNGRLHRELTRRCSVLSIRYSAIDDAKTLGEIQSASWRAAYKGIVSDEILGNFSPEARAERFRYHSANSEGKNVIAFCDGEAAGFITIGKCRDDDMGEDCGEVWSLYLKPEFWKRGIGSSLLCWGMEDLRKKVSIK